MMTPTLYRQLHDETCKRLEEMMRRVNACPAPEDATISLRDGYLDVRVSLLSWLTYDRALFDPETQASFDSWLASQGDTPRSHLISAHRLEQYVSELESRGIVSDKLVIDTRVQYDLLDMEFRAIVWEQVSDDDDARIYALLTMPRWQRLTIVGWAYPVALQLDDMYDLARATFAEIACAGDAPHYWVCEDAVSWLPVDTLGAFSYSGEHPTQLQNYPIISIASRDDWEPGALCWLSTDSESIALCPICGSALEVQGWG